MEISEPLLQIEQLIQYNHGEIDQFNACEMIDQIMKNLCQYHDIYNTYKWERILEKAIEMISFITVYYSIDLNIKEMNEIPDTKACPKYITEQIKVSFDNFTGKIHEFYESIMIKTCNLKIHNDIIKIMENVRELSSDVDDFITMNTKAASGYLMKSKVLISDVHKKIRTLNSHEIWKSFLEIHSDTFTDKILKCKNYKEDFESISTLMNDLSYALDNCAPIRDITMNDLRHSFKIMKILRKLVMDIHMDTDSFDLKMNYYFINDFKNILFKFMNQTITGQGHDLCTNSIEYIDNYHVKFVFDFCMEIIKFYNELELLPIKLLGITDAMDKYVRDSRIMRNHKSVSTNPMTLSILKLAHTRNIYLTNDDYIQLCINNINIFDEIPLDLKYNEAWVLKLISHPNGCLFYEHLRSYIDTKILKSYILMHPIIIKEVPWYIKKDMKLIVDCMNENTAWTLYSVCNDLSFKCHPMIIQEAYEYDMRILDKIPKNGVVSKKIMNALHGVNLMGFVSEELKKDTEIQWKSKKYHRNIRNIEKSFNINFRFHLA